MLKATIKRLVLWHDADMTEQPLEAACFAVYIDFEKDVHTQENSMTLYEALKDA